MKNLGKYRALNKYPSHIIVLSEDRRILFLNKHFSRSNLAIFKNTENPVNDDLHLEDILELKGSEINKIRYFIEDKEYDENDILFINVYDRNCYLALYPVFENQFILEIIDLYETRDPGLFKNFIRDKRKGFLLYQSGTLRDKLESKQKQDFFRSIINDSIDGFFLLDDHFYLLQYNKSFNDVFSSFDLSEEKIYFPDIVGPQSKRMLKKKLQSVVHLKKSVTAEISITDQEKTRYCLISLNPVRSEESNLKQIYGFAKDITEIKHLQNQLEIERNYNRGIIENVNLGFVFYNDNNEYIDFNNEYLNILGREKSELIGANIYDFTVPEYTAVQKNFMKEMMSTGESVIFEQEILRKDGTIIPVLVSMSRLYTKDGAALGNYVFIKDISEQKQIENELIEKNLKLQNLTNIYNNISAKLMTCERIDEIYTVLYDSVSRILHTDSFEILAKRGSGYKSVFSYKAVSRPAVNPLDKKISLLIKMIEDKKSPLHINDIYTEINDEDLSVFPGLKNYKSAIFIPILIHEETSLILILSFREPIKSIDSLTLKILTGITGLGSIIIEKIMSAKEHVQMQSALERYERLTAMGRIIAGVAHEINNPLSIMQLDIDELKTICNSHDCFQETEDNNIVNMINSMQEEIGRLGNIVNQLRDYYNPVSEFAEEVHIDEVLKSFPLKIFIKNLEKKGIRVNLLLKAGKSAIKISKNRIVQILINLLTNADDAVKEIPDACITIKTELIEKDVPIVAISVDDNGTGIPEEIQEKIFEPFFTTKKSEGTGLGLSISYSIIKSYEGEIALTSKENEGTEFKILFPLFTGSSYSTLEKRL